MTALLTGLGLAAAAGFNAWAVLLLFHGLVRLLPQDFPGPAAAFLASPFVFQLALVLFLAEFVVTKIPLARSLLGARLTLSCGRSWARFSLSPPSALPSWPARAGVALAAAIVTLGAHVAKSTTRLDSTAATQGFTQFALSLAEDIVAVVLATLVFFLPWLTALVLSALLILLLTHGSARPARPGSPVLPHRPAPAARVARQPDRSD